MITNAVSLFDGIGGFPLALSRSGIETVATAEIDAPCRRLTERNLPTHRSFIDVTEVTGGDLIGAGFEPETGILTAGWPCQGNSVAGRRLGMADSRSALWSSTERLLAETRPRWFLGENVPGLLSVNNGRDFLAVVKALDGLGYGVAWRVLDAQYFGVPQRRKRVFIVGCLGDGASPAEVLFEPENVSGDSAQNGEAGTADTGAVVVSTLQGGGKRGWRVDAEGAAGGHLIVNALTSGHGNTTSYETNLIPYPADCYNGNIGTPDGPMFTLSTQAVHNRSLVGQDVGVRRLTPLECERLQGFPDDWTAGQSDSARYRELGNAVAVPVVEWLTRRIVSLETTSNRREAA